MRRPLLLAAAIALLPSAGACEGGTDGVVDPDPSACVDGEGSWGVACPAPIGPGELLTLTVRDVPDDTELYIFIGDDPLDSFRVTWALDDESGDKQVAIPFPRVAEGVYQVAVGTADGPRSDPVPVEVRFPERRYERAEAADLLREGFAGVGADVRSVFEADVEGWTEAREELYSPEELAHVLEALDAYDRGVAILYEEYLALSDDDERTVNAVFQATGLFERLEAFRAGDPDYVPGRAVASLDESYVLTPLHRWVVQLDVLSMVLDLSSMFLDGVTIAAVLGLVTAPAGVVIEVSSVLMALVKAAIDIFVPTDIARLESHGQGIMHSGVDRSWIVWGTFIPQNDLGSNIRTIGDLALTVGAAAVPGPRALAEQAARQTTEVVTRLLARFGLSFTYVFAEADGLTQLSMTVPLDMRVYSLSVSTFLSTVLAPWGDGFARIPIFNALSLSDGIQVDRERTTHPGAQEAVAASWHDWDRLSVRDIVYESDSSVEAVPVALELRAWSWGQTDLPYVLYIPMPWPGDDVVLDVEELVSVQNIEDPADSNDLHQHERIQYLVTEPDAHPIQGLNTVITAGTPDTREYFMRLWQVAGGFGGPASIRVTVNGEPKDLVQPPYFFSSGSPSSEVFLQLEPGWNTITVHDESGRAPQPCGVTGTRGGWGCVVAQFPGANNDDITRPVFLGQTPGGRYTFEVWTPPRHVRP